MHFPPWEPTCPAVIVGSILLAFGIEAWWQDKQETDTGESLVALLLVDLAQDISELERRNARADSIISGLQEMSRIMDGAVPSPSVDSLTILFNHSTSASSFTPSLSAYEVLTGTLNSDFLPLDLNIQLAEYVGGYEALDLALQVLALAVLQPPDPDPRRLT